MQDWEVKVSIIVPIYNVEKYLNRCVDSILTQTYGNLEIILVDDGSPDKSPQICDSYAEQDKRVKVIHKTNAGVSAARNSGIEIATGEYICFADGDDYLMPDYVEYLLKLALDNNVDVALTTEMFSNYYSNQIEKDDVLLYTGEEATEKILCYKIPIGVYCKIFKRSFLGSDIRFLTDVFIGEGFNFNTMAFQKANNVAIGRRRVYYYRRDNATSATTKFSEKKWINGLHSIQIIKNNLIIKTERLYNAIEYADWRTHADVLVLMEQAKAQKQYPEMYKKCKKLIRKNLKYAFIVPCRRTEKFKAILFAINPHLVTWMMNLRRKFYRVHV